VVFAVFAGLLIGFVNEPRRDVAASFFYDFVFVPAISISVQIENTLKPVSVFRIY
jgi:hypothetical protein